MTAREFFDLVARMREMQNLYLNTRKDYPKNLNPYLSKVKSIERQVDWEIRRVKDILNKQALAEKESCNEIAGNEQTEVEN